MSFLLIILLSFIISTLAIPVIISVAFKKRLFDSPSETRKIHKRIIPNLGGVAIFTSLLFTASLFVKTEYLHEANFILGGGLVLFMIGLKDDLIGVSPLKKFSGQFTSALIVAVLANLRIVTLNGFLNVYELPYAVSVLITTLFIVGIVNAINLIDGIDGLAGTISVLITLVFGILFFHLNEIGWSYLCIAFVGALLGFLVHNYSPARIFMGDCGSLVCGFIIAILSIKFLNVSNNTVITINSIAIHSSLGLTLSILIIPIFDTIRVFTIRILKKGSPFKADSNHLHHRLLFLGFSHIQATLILTLVNILCITLAILFQDIGEAKLIGLIFLVALALNGILTLFIKHHKEIISSKDLAKTSVEPSKKFAEKILQEITKSIN